VDRYVTQVDAISHGAIDDEERGRRYREPREQGKRHLEGHFSSKLGIAECMT
jgi:hypothetical protein